MAQNWHYVQTTMKFGFLQKSGNEYKLEAKLMEHDQVVTGIDWAPKSNRIVTCSQDRNAYVWTLEGGVWKPVLVILRINRAATHVRWSPEENKFAVASGSKLVSVCYFESDNDWWVSKHIKKHKSTVLHVDWHPNNVLLVTASSDFKCRVFSSFIKGLDKGNPQSSWGPISTFGDLQAELDQAGGWVQSARWSPSGNKIAFVSQDSTLYVADCSGSTPSVSSVKTSDLPFRDVLFITEDNLVAVGHDCTPVQFKNSGGWKLVGKVDKGDTKPAAPAGGAKKPDAFSKFQSAVDKGTSAVEETVLTTKHQNCITIVNPYKKSGNNVTQFSTTGLDGALIIWDAPQ